MFGLIVRTTGGPVVGTTGSPVVGMSGGPRGTTGTVGGMLMDLEVTTYEQG